MTDAAFQTPPVARGGLYDLLFSRTWAGRPYLISPVMDTFLAGGGALVLLIFFLLLMPEASGAVNRDTITKTAAVFALISYVVNYPHFMASYALLYGSLDERMGAYSRNSLTWWRYAVAAYIVPIGLILFFAYCLLTKSYHLLGYSVHMMFFFVGWHYAKQSYGVFVVLSGMKGIYYSSTQVLFLKLHVYSLWFYSWFSSGSVVLESMSPRTMNFHRISYNGLNLFKTPEVVQALAWVAIACAVLGWGAILWNWIETRKRPSISALIGYTTMYTLLAFVRIHPLFAYASPMFHSLQYMLFVYAYKRGEFSTELAEHHHEDKKLDRPIWYRHLSYFLLMCAT